MLSRNKAHPGHNAVHPPPIKEMSFERRIKFVNTYLIGIRGAIANGTERTFDGQPMQPGNHLRWGFAPELGFPPEGFQLCRKVAGQGERHITPPSRIWTTAGTTLPTTQTSSPATSPESSSLLTQGNGNKQGIHENGETGSSSQHSPLWQPEMYEWHARLPETCHQVSVTGLAATDAKEVILETYAQVSLSKTVITGRQHADVVNQHFSATVRAATITHVRILGACEIHTCDCSIIDPPRTIICNDDKCRHKDKHGCRDRRDTCECEHRCSTCYHCHCRCSCGGNGGGGGGPIWGAPGQDGWQCLSSVFTLPITDANWPTHYAGAPAPSASDVVQQDVDECIRRLSGLSLAVNLDALATRDQLMLLRASLSKLVHGFSSTLLYDVPIDAPLEDGANAPQLNMNLMQQLLLLALNPYMARGLGLYFVDTDVQPGTIYDYYLVGLWGNTPCASRTVSLGTTSATQLAQGNALNSGVAISAYPPNSTTVVSTLSRWTSASGPLTYPLQIQFLWGQQLTSPESFSNVAAGTTTELLVIQTQAPTPVQVCWLTLKRPVAQVAIQVASVGRIIAQSNGITIATQEFNTLVLTTVTLASPSPTDQPIDTLILEAYGSTIIAGELVLYLLPQGAIGNPYMICHVDTPMTPLDAPSQPVSISRRRQAEIDPQNAVLITRSNIEVQWVAPPDSTVSGTPQAPPLNIPLPNQPIGYRATRLDSGAQNIILLPRIIAPMSLNTPIDSPLYGANPPIPRIARFVDADVPDPVGGWVYQVAAFDTFGALGKVSAGSDPLEIQPAAALPTRINVIRFDNSANSGGVASVDGLAWTGATLTMQVS